MSSRLHLPREIGDRQFDTTPQSRTDCTNWCWEDENFEFGTRDRGWVIQRNDRDVATLSILLESELRHLIIPISQIRATYRRSTHTSCPAESRDGCYVRCNLLATNRIDLSISLAQDMRDRVAQGALNCLVFVGNHDRLLVNREIGFTRLADLNNRLVTDVVRVVRR